MTRSWYTAGECLAIAVVASACGGDSDTGKSPPGSGGMASGGGGSGGRGQGTGGALATGGTAATGGAADAGGTFATGGVARTGGSAANGGAAGAGNGSARGGSAVTGGVAGSGGAGGGGTGGSDCQCPSAAWEPVCGVDGNTHNAVCGADCVPVDIACVGECPCDAGGASCDLGCEAPPDVGWCESPTVTWECDAIDHIDLFVEIGCQELPTGMVRYCCSAGFLSECQ